MPHDALASPACNVGDGTAFAARLRNCARMAAALVVAIPCAVLAGWAFEVEALKRVLPGLVAMNPLTACAFLAAGAGLAVATRPGGSRALSAACATVVFLTGGVIFMAYVLGLESGLDRILFASSLGHNVMAPTTAFNFILAGLALGLLDWETARGGRPAQVLAVLGALLALLALTGYFYKVETLYRLSGFIAMALHTAFCFFLLTGGLLCARADRGLMARFSSGRAGGAMLRRLLFAQIAVPLVLGWLILLGHRAGRIETALGFSLFVVFTILFVATLSWRNAALLDREDTERNEAEEGLREMGTGLERAVRERTAELTQAVAGIRDGLAVLGSSSSDVLRSSSALSTSANQTAASVAETTTALEEVRQTARLASDRSQAVAEDARETAEISGAGTRATSDTTAGMERIRAEMQSIAGSMRQLGERTHAIGEIIAAVDDLAEQSNLLAVNAAIEAAKAGEQGKGFAVVADEVRFLAGQSRKATLQVRTILTDIQKAANTAALTTEQAVKAVEAGVATASQAGESIVSLASKVGGAAETAAQIADSTEQQLVGLEHIARAIDQVRTASVQNVAQAKQLEAAARSLNELGQRLKELVETHETAAP